MKKLNSSPSQKGFSLVLVLLVLCLITALIVSFLVLVTAEEITAKNQKASAEALRLSDTVVQIVMAQIRDATTDTTSGSKNAWASQPGAIRTYDNTGKPQKVFKLYSDTNPIDVTGSYNPQNDWATAGWSSSPELYTDLNAPAQKIYPIFDPGAAGTLSTIGPTANITSQAKVDGLYLYPGAAPLNDTGNTNAAAMPVKWLYILKDGEIVAPDPVQPTPGQVKFSSAQTAPGSPFKVNGINITNTIIGRVAFWTDDETCKLNVNTASEGTYWDTPTYSTGLDVAYNNFQPANYEFSRYSGHPASTCLSPALWSYLGLPDPAATMSAFTVSDSSYSFGMNRTQTTPGPTGVLPSYASTALPLIYGTTTPGLNPRSYWGGSQAGSVNTLTTTAGGVTIAKSNIRHDRLYSTIDEFLFSNSVRTTTPPASPNIANLKPADISRLRFILTTNSHSPEVNAFGLPKVAIWPIPAFNTTNPANGQWKSVSNQSARDKLIAYSATLNNSIYYFDRMDPTSATVDPQRPRNAVVYNYLRLLMDQPFPGFGSSFTNGKWTAFQCDQVMTEIYDYIRGCINLADGSNNDGTAAYTFPYAYTNPPTQLTGANTTGVVTGSGAIPAAPSPGTGQVVPATITNPDGLVTKGLGRFPTLRAATLMFIARAANQPPFQVFTTGPNAGRPLIFDSTGSSSHYLDASGNLTQTGAQLILSNGAYAKVNPMHPWNNAPAYTNGLIPQLVTKAKDSKGNTVICPVLAYNNSKENTSPATDISGIYPIFDLSANSNLPTYTYPTLDSLIIPNPNYDPTKPPSTSNPQDITISNLFVANTTVSSPNGVCSTFQLNTTPTPTIYPFCRAENDFRDGQTAGYPPTLGSGPGKKPIDSTINPTTVQTHAGLPFLSVQRAVGTSTSGTMEGAFDFPNPAYKDTSRFPATDNTQFPPYATAVEAILIPELANPAPGNVPYYPNFNLRISGLDAFSADGTLLGFPKSATEQISINTTSVGALNPGNYNGFFSNISYSPTISSRYTNSTGYSGMPFFSTPLLLKGSKPDNGQTFSFVGGNIAVQFQTRASRTLQTININFPSTTFPVPKLTPWWSAAGQVTPAFMDCPPQLQSELVPSWMLTFNRQDSDLSKSANASRLTVGNTLRGQYRFIIPEFLGANNVYYNLGCDTLRSIELTYGDIRQVAALQNVPNTFYQPNPLYYDFAPHQVHFSAMQPFTTYSRLAHSIYLNDCAQSCTQLQPLNDAVVTANPVVTPNALYLTNPDGYALNHLGCTPSLNYPAFTRGLPSSGTFPANIMINNLNPINLASGTQTTAVAAALKGAGYNGTGPYTTYPFTTPSVDFTDPTFKNRVWANGGDFDNGEGLYADGPFIGKVDEGDAEGNFYNNTINAVYGVSGASLFSPNRMVPSPVIFGSLPVGFGQAGSAPTTNPDPSTLLDSWQTLLFCPNPNSSNSTLRDTRTQGNGIPEAGAVPTAGKVPDYALLDLFYMPVVEPYSMSDSYATAGKVNMNYQMAPFTYITRNTAVRGVLKSVLINAVDDKWSQAYKYRATSTDNPAGYSFGNDAAWLDLGNKSAWMCFRYPIHLAQTLNQFEQRFLNGDIFRSPSEICSLWLYPSAQPTLSAPDNAKIALVDWDAANAAIKSWWYDKSGDTRKALTGDNKREKPYADIYPRLTTKSNTYMIHYRVQLLKQAQGTDLTQWLEPNYPGAQGTRDYIQSEYRGSSLIERYIDPNDTTLPDFATNVINGDFSDNLDKHYKFRVISTRRFAP